ncbi:hypothetical protein AB3N59_06455 [Leptospira sp. WS92.C1]
MKPNIFFSLLKILAIHVFVLLIALPSSLMEAQSDKRYVWVSMSIQDNGSTQAPAEYYGKIEESLFEKIADNTLQKGFFKLEEIFWTENGGWIKMNLFPLKGADNGVETDISKRRDASQYYGYSGTAFFRIETVTRITILDKEFLKKVLPSLK